MQPTGNRYAGICAVFVMLWAHGQGMAPLLLGQSHGLTTVFRGQELTYEVIDGMAIHGGDIILGTAEEAAAASLRHGPTVSRKSKARLAAPDSLSAATSVESEYLWPGGVIPYVIDADVTNSQDILRAIEEWNSKTVISLVERTTQEDYVRFRSVGQGCRAHQGRIGGEQFISLHETCDWRIVVHEIGHAVGMWHEHQRQDRHRYLMVHDGFVSLCSNPFALAPEAKVERPYDYASTMHYGRGPFADLPWMETIPPGISILSAFTPAPLSSGDIDYMARLYGQPPTATTISTNPPGLDIIVDGVRHTTPAIFDWAPGSTHHIEAPSLQTGINTILGTCCNDESTSTSPEDERTRYVFGSWTDEGSRAHPVTADPDTTWYQANYIVQLYVVPRAEPPEAGRMTIRPESPDGFYTIGSPIEITAIPNPEYNFLDWRGRWFPGSGRINWFPGDSWNPARVHVGLNGRAPQVYAYFSDRPVFSIEADGFAYGPTILNNRGRYIALPVIYDVDHFRSQFADDDGNIRVVAADDGVAAAGVDPSPGFLRWSDGVVGSRNQDDQIVREVEVLDEGGELASEWETHVPLFDPRILGEGRVQIHSPPLEHRRGYWSDTRYYVQGARVELTAVPESPDERFVGWSGGVYGTNPVTSLVMDGPKRVEAFFTWLPILRPGEQESGDLSRVLGYWTYVPLGATELAVDVELEDSESDAVLAISQGGYIWIDDNGQIVGAEFQARSSNGTARIAITPETAPPLATGPYFVSVVAREAALNGKLNVGVARGLSVQAYPRAFTFVAPPGVDPAAQTFLLTNKGIETLHFEIGSNQPWLSASPRQGSLAAGEAAEVSVAVSGTVPFPDTHTGKLIIKSQKDSGLGGPGVLDALESATSSLQGHPELGGGVEIPVTFAVVD